MHDLLENILNQLSKKCIYSETNNSPEAKLTHMNEYMQGFGSKPKANVLFEK